MKNWKDDYIGVPDGTGGVKLVRCIAHQTHDAAVIYPPLANAIAHHQGELRKLLAINTNATGGSRTTDEILESMNTGKLTARGTVWEGGKYPKLDEALDPVRAFVRGFVGGNVVNAEDPTTVLNLGRTYLPRVTGAEERKATEEAIEKATKAWREHSATEERKSGPLLPGWDPSNLLGTTFTPGGEGKGARDHDPACDKPIVAGTTDSRGADLRRMFSTAPSVAYAERLRQGRATMDGVAPAKVRTSADYAANLAAGRQKQRA